MIRSPDDLQALIRSFEASAQSHIQYARCAHTEFQRRFHEHRAAQALLQADRYRHARPDQDETAGRRPPAVGG